MQRFSSYVSVIVLAWAFHRLARAVFGFPLFSLTDFSAREFAVDFGVYIVSFFAAYLLIRRTKDRRNESEE